MKKFLILMLVSVTSAVAIAGPNGLEEGYNALDGAVHLRAATDELLQKGCESNIEAVNLDIATAYNFTSILVNQSYDKEVIKTLKAGIKRAELIRDAKLKTCHSVER